MYNDRNFNSDNYNVNGNNGNNYNENNYNMNGNNRGNNYSHNQQGGGSSSSKVLILIIIVALLGAGYWFFIREDNGRESGNPSGSNNNSTAYLKFSNDRISLSVSEEKDLSTLLVNGSGNIVWRSGNDSVVTVDSMGKISGVSKGQTIVTATDAKGSSAAINVEVVSNGEEVQKIILDQDGITQNADGTYVLSLAYGQKFTLIPKLIPENAINKQLEFIVSTPSVLNVEVSADKQSANLSFLTSTSGASSSSRSSEQRTKGETKADGTKTKMAATTVMVTIKSSNNVQASLIVTLGGNGSTTGKSINGSGGTGSSGSGSHSENSSSQSTSGDSRTAGSSSTGSSTTTKKDGTSY